MFLNGQKVVCIDAKFPLGIEKIMSALPEEGKVYPVRGMAPAVEFSGEETICVYLVGLQNPCSDVATHRERGFRPERFEPLQELTADEILMASVPAWKVKELVEA
jgi:hypothetical protein